MKLSDNDRKAYMAVLRTIVGRINDGTATDADRAHFDKIEAKLMDSQ